ncbi:hypothetical protein ABT124_34425 [Streptomyces sp. NPDC001982]|uniref:hypothetical protein n=1 Tax=Streptomyces sp. NPDC001982 TaxID=3154405 RepID=UPI0033329B78
METDQVRAIAVRLRHAMKAAHDGGDLACFATETFPDGYCGVAADFLCQYLCDERLGDAWQRVSGEVPQRDAEPGPRPTHACAEWEDVIVDITAGQFPGRPAVFVGSQDAWYCGITRTGSGAGGIAGYMNADAVRKAYEAVWRRASAD